VLGFYGFASVPLAAFVLFESSLRLAATAAPLLYKRYVFIIFEMVICIEMVISNACVY